MDFGIVPLEMLPAAWNKCLPIISKSCEYNGNFDSPEDIYKLIAIGKKYLWLAIDGPKILGVVLTSLEEYPLKKTCSIDICTGHDLDKWIGNLSTIEKWARDNGCAEMFVMARLGYVRKLKEFQYRNTHAFLQKDLR